MNKWGFYFNQDRCIGCKTCMSACKNWNDERRGDVGINVRDLNEYVVKEGELDKGSNYIDPVTGESNYPLYRKYYMKENWRQVTEFERGAVVENDKHVFEYNLDRRYISIGCNHCDDPACIKVCPTGCISKEQTYGAVIVNNSACISCGRCQDACPWDAPQFYDRNYREYMLNDPRRPKMTKCTMCLDRLKENRRPACVAACWNRALDAGPMEDMQRKYGTIETLDEFACDYVAGLNINTGPNIVFKKKR